MKGSEAHWSSGPGGTTGFAFPGRNAADFSLTNDGVRFFLGTPLQTDGVGDACALSFGDDSLGDPDGDGICGEPATA